MLVGLGRGGAGSLRNVVHVLLYRVKTLCTSPFGKAVAESH